MKPLARKYGDKGWRAAVTLDDGRVRVVSRKFYDNPDTARLYAELWASLQVEKAAKLNQETRQ
jgi:hypothetical protein